MVKATSIIYVEGAYIVELSIKDQEIYDFIKSFVLKNNLVPSFREIADGTNLKSLSTVHHHMKTLIKAGLIIPYGDKSIRYSVKGLKVVET